MLHIFGGFSLTSLRIAYISLIALLLPSGVLVNCWSLNSLNSRFSSLDSGFTSQDSRFIVLSFSVDDVSGLNDTLSVLGVRATFFCTSRFISDFGYALRWIALNGHEVAVHLNPGEDALEACRTVSSWIGWRPVGYASLNYSAPPINWLKANGFHYDRSIPGGTPKTGDITFLPLTLYDGMLLSDTSLIDYGLDWMDAYNLILNALNEFGFVILEFHASEFNYNCNILLKLQELNAVFLRCCDYVNMLLGYNMINFSRSFVVRGSQIEFNYSSFNGVVYEWFSRNVSFNDFRGQLLSHNRSWIRVEVELNPKLNLSEFSYVDDCWNMVWIDLDEGFCPQPIEFTYLRFSFPATPLIIGLIYFFLLSAYAFHEYSRGNSLPMLALALVGVALAIILGHPPATALAATLAVMLASIFYLIFLRRTRS